MKRGFLAVLAFALGGCPSSENAVAVCQRVNGTYGFGWDKEQLAQCKELHGRRDNGERQCVDGCLVAKEPGPFKQCYENCIGPIRPPDMGLGNGSYH